MGVTDSDRATGTGSRVTVPCPACGRPFSWPPTAPCERCAADLAGPVAAGIFDLDRRAARVQEQRAAAVEELRAAAAAARAALPPPAGPGVRNGDAMPAPVRTGASSGAAAGPSRPSSIRPQVFLAGAGAALLLAAAVVFIAVTWPTWPPSAQAAFVTVLTVVGAVGARTAARRDLPVTAEAVGVATIAIAGYSLLAAQREGFAGLDALDPVLWFGLVAAGVAAVTRPFTSWAGLRDTPRRLGAVAAVVAAGAGLTWLVRVLDTVEPEVLLVGAAPVVAVALLLHARWGLRPDDPFRYATRVAPMLLVVGAAVGTGLLPLDGASAVAVLAAAVVGLPALVLLRQSRQDDPWTAVGATVAVGWAVLLATFLLTDVIAELVGPAQPRLVTCTVAAAALGAVSWWRPSPAHWRLPVLVATSVAAVPALVWTFAVWSARAEIVVAVLESPFTGWPAAAALTVTDVVFGVVAVVATSIVVAHLQPAVVRGFLLLAGGAVLAVTVVAGAAAGTVGFALPSLLAALAAVIAGVVWTRDATRWVPVALTEVAAVGLAVVDLDLFAGVAAAVAVHLLVVAATRRSEVAAALGVASGLAAVGAAGAAFDQPTTTITLLVTLVAGAAMVWSQFADACRPWRALPTDLVVLLGAAAAVGTALAEGGASTSVAIQLAVVAVVAAVHAARPGRGWVVWLSSLAVSASTWTLLADRGVEVVEAYTLPAAVALAVAGGWRLHTTTASSWTAYWPACAMAALPTLAVLLEGSDPVRVLLLTTGAVAVALVGHWRRLAAPLVLGAVVAAVTALLQLYDWTAGLPRWVTFGALGALLIWASATYEAQLRRARQLRQHLARLR